MRHDIIRGVLCGAVMLLGLAALPARAQNYVYVGEFGGELHRFNLDGTPNPAGNFISGATVTEVEGINSLGSNLVFAAKVNGQRGIHLFNRASGAYVSTPVPVTTGDIILDIQVAQNQSTVYLSQYNPNAVRAFNMNTGSLLSELSRPATPWGIAIHPITGEIYHTLGWDTLNNPSRGVYRSPGDLSTVQDVVTAGLGNLDGITAPAGLTFLPNGDMFVVNGANGDTNNTFVNRYNYNAGTNAYTFAGTLDTLNPSDLANGFDAEIGPDGALYVSSAIGACVARFDLTTGAASTFIPPGAGGLPGAKTIHFEFNGVNTTVPEPGSVALLGGMVVMGGLALRRRAGK